jgi:nicotinamidase-related amidase
VTLLDRDDSILVVVDAQPGFYTGEELEADDARGARIALERATWLARLAAVLEIPAVITEEDAERNGSTDAGIAEALPPYTPAFAKPTFGLAGTPEILEAVRATGRGTAVLVGFETDVCVAQSAIGLLGEGMRAVLVADAVFSPGEMHARGLARATAAGVELNHVKGVAYEWLRELETARSVIDGSPELSDAPVRL